ncbi:MAG: cupin-like domain-containing protein [Taibaiella sp.]|nr:cupin-like domain-containing protein [Taibaiella sp.]
MELQPVKKVSGLSVKEFRKDYMKASMPVILTDFVKTESPAWKKWSYDYFKQLAGDTMVNVYGKEEDSMDRAASAPVDRMTFGEYLDHIEREADGTQVVPVQPDEDQATTGS